MIHKSGRTTLASDTGAVLRGTITFLLTCIARILLPLPLRFLYGLQTRGKENLKKIGKTGAITVSNHCQYIEPIFTGLVLWPRRVWYVVENNNIERKDVGWLNRLLGAIGIPPQNPMSISIPIRSALENHHIVHFYPEGRLYYRNQQLRPFYTGAFLIALRNNVPVLPLTEVLHERKLSKVLSFLPPKVTFVIEAPVFPEEIRGLVESPRKRSAVFASYVQKTMQNTIDVSVNGRAV